MGQGSTKIQNYKAYDIFTVAALYFYTMAAQVDHKFYINYLNNPLSLA